MDEKLVKKVLIHLEPSKDQEEKMWKKIEQYESNVTETEKIKKHSFGFGRIKRTGFAYRLGIATLVAIFMAGTVAIADAATGGIISDKIGEVINKTIGKEEERQIVDQAGKVSDQNIEVYASDILHMDDELLIFGNMRGIIVYDLLKDSVLGTIDTQDIDCIYFDSEEKETCLYKEGDSIFVFNIENKNISGSVYEYQWKKQERMTLVRSINEKDLIKKIYQKWEKSQNYIDTFQAFSENDAVDIHFNCFDKDCNCKYSRRSIVCNDKVCFLYMKDRKYYLCTVTNNQKNFSKRELILNYKNDEENLDEKTMPEFIYDGNDAELNTIVEYMKKEGESYLTEEGSVWIPGFVIYKKVEKNGETLIFGNFYNYIYQKIGNIMESNAGGEYPACFHLKKSGDSYKVVSVDTAGGGEDYAKDIKRFTKGYHGLYEKYMDWDTNKVLIEEAKNDYIKMYISRNSLDVKYYKDYGWDPVKIK